MVSDVSLSRNCTERVHLRARSGPTILKLTFWVSGTNSSTLEGKRALCVSLSEPELSFHMCRAPQSLINFQLPFIKSQLGIPSTVQPIATLESS